MTVEYPVGQQAHGSAIVEHTCQDIIQELAQRMDARDRHLIFLFGAGASCAANLPDLIGLKLGVESKLEGRNLESYRSLSDNRNIEEILTRLRLIAQALDGGYQILDGFTAAAARELDRQICSKIAEIIADTPAEQTHHQRFGRWVSRAQHDQPVEIFTTNYDLMLEKGLEWAAAPYFDGFVGSIVGRFRADMVDGEASSQGLQPPHRWVRLWKLHGSVSWVNEVVDEVKIVSRLPAAVLSEGENSLAIYPAPQGYEGSSRSPFAALSDRLRRSLAIPHTTAVICGYSFGIKHINELIFDGLRYNPSCEVVALFHGEIPDLVASQALALPNFKALGAREAIIGTRRGVWVSRPDAGGVEYISQNGHFSLGDFRVLASVFSSASIVED